MAELKDSGARRVFDSGATRDISSGKGRCDLLPLDVVAKFLAGLGFHGNPVLLRIHEFMITKDPDKLYSALAYFCNAAYMDKQSALLEVSKQYEDGAKKYADRNWEKGLPLHCFIDSGVRHYLKWLRGDRDEPHDRAFTWNILGALWTLEHKPELDDIDLNGEEV